MNFYKKCFTLAEVLIVIGVIGVVAAITIPTLINTISPKAKEAQTKTIEARLLDGINRYSAMEDGLSQKYETTYDFLLGLSKYYKMSQICKADEITKCIPYSKIYSNDGTLNVDVSSLTTIENLMAAGDAANNYLAPASFITSQGTPVIMAFKKNCVWDMGTAMRSIEDSGCIAYMYDKNGTGLPNKVGEDLIGHGISIKGLPLAVLGGVKIMTNVFYPTVGLTLEQCRAEIEDEEKAKYQAINGDIYIKECWSLGNGGDRWAYAMKYCKEQGFHLPTEVQLASIANALYKGMNASATDNTYNAPKYGTNNAAIGSNQPLPLPLLGLGSSYYYLWSSHEDDSRFSYYRVFTETFTKRGHNDTYRNGPHRAVCVID